VLFTLGGTVAMAGTERDAVARLGGADLVAGIDGLGDVEVRDLSPVPSADLSFTNLLDIVDVAGGAVRSSARGVGSHAGDGHA
jgi:L-asparaginase